MDHKQIINIIQANSTLSYPELEKQALEAGLSEKEIRDAWNVVQRTFRNHDKQVAEIMREVSSAYSGKSSMEVKNSLSKKDYENDEVDLGYALSRIKQNKKFSLKDFISSLFTALSIGTFLFLILIGLFSLEAKFRPFLLILVFLVTAFVFCIEIIGRWRKTVIKKVISIDFDATPLNEHQVISIQNYWHQNGGVLIKRGEQQQFDLYKTIYDKRETYFGNFTYIIGDGKEGQALTHLLVAQKINRSFPPVQCYKVTSGMTDHPFAARTIFSKEHVTLEGMTFNKIYNLMATDRGVDATYVFNPRLMSLFLKPENVGNILFCETAGDFILTGFRPLNTTGKWWRLTGPLLKYQEYVTIKSHLLKCLDITSDAADILQHEIVDKGNKRSIAKEGFEELKNRQ